MKRVMTLASLLTMCALPVAAWAQAPAPPAPTANPLSTSAALQFGMVKNYIVKSAEKVPEDVYAFKPTPEVRSFGALVAHVANANYSICSAAAGVKSPSTADIEKTMTSKADLVKAVTESFTYCEGIYAKMTDAAGTETVDFFGRKSPKLGVLNFNTAHTFEHYGNMVTYMRLKGIVPASSERGGM